MPLTDLVVVDQPDALPGALAMLEDLEHVGLDVERADWDRYYRAAALIQIGGSGRVAVIDPLAGLDLTPLDEYLRGRVSVFHAVENDLDPLVTLGVKPTVICDTAVAAAVLGMPTGLEHLLRDVLGVELAGDKSAMQRANWEARPLTDDMLAYAAGDVADLPELWITLAARLEQAGRFDWYEQEIAAVLALPSVEDRRNWGRTKGAGRLDSASRARLQALWQTREDLARSTDTAPGRIASDAILVDLAATPPTTVGDLGRRGLRRQAVREYGKSLIQALTEVAGAAAPSARRSRAPLEADRALIDTLRQIRAARAEVLGIQAGVLCPSRTLAPAVLSDPSTPEELRAALDLRRWQWEQLGAAFCAAAGITGDDVPPPPADPEPTDDEERQGDGRPAQP